MMEGLQQIILVHTEAENRTSVLIGRDRNGQLWRGYVMLSAKPPAVEWTPIEETIR